MTPPQRRPRSALVRTGLTTGVGAGAAGRSPDGGWPHGQPAWAATPGPLGPETLTSRCGLVVLVNQAAEPVPPPDSTGEWGSTSAGLAVDTPRRAKRHASVRSLVVVVAHILGEHPLKVAPTPDQHPVQTLLPDCPHPALGERVGIRRLHRCGDDLDAVGGEHVIEGAGELAVPVANQELRRDRDPPAAPSSTPVPAAPPRARSDGV
jgi:hypothetical protein